MNESNSRINSKPTQKPRRSLARFGGDHLGHQLWRDKRRAIVLPRAWFSGRALPSDFILLLPAMSSESPRALIAGIPLGLILLAVFLCETYGVAITSASNAAFLISLCVVFTPLVEWQMFEQRPPTSALLAAGVSLGGALLLTQAAPIEMNRGDWLMIAAAIARACLVCWTKKLTQETHISALALTGAQSGVVGFGSLGAMMLGPGELPHFPTDLGFWMATVYLVVFGTLFAFFAQNYAVKRTSPTRASLLMGLEPLFGALFATLWLNEQLGFLAWIGGSMMVAASLWAGWSRSGEVETSG